MPTVPQYNRQPVQQERLPGVKVTTQAPVEAFGGGTEGMQRAFGNAAEAGINLFQEEKTRARNLRARRAKEEIDQKIQSSLFDPEKGYISQRKGEQAINVSKDGTGDFDKWYSDYTSKQAWDDETRYMVDTYWMDSRTTAIKQLNQHESGEIDALDKTTLESFVSNKKRIAGTAALNEEVVENQKKLMLDEIKNSIQVQRMGKDYSEAYTAKHLSDFRAGHINSILANGNNTYAREVFKKYENELDPDDKAKISKLLDNDVAEAQIAADKIFAVAGVDPVKQDALIRQMPPGELRAKTQKELAYKVKNFNEAQKLYAQGVFAGASQQLFQAKGDITKVDPKVKLELVKTGQLDEFARNAETYKQHIFVSDPEAKSMVNEMDDVEIARMAMSDPKEFAALTAKLGSERGGKEALEKKLANGKKILEQYQQLEKGEYKPLVDNIVKSFPSFGVDAKDVKRRDVFEEDIKGQMATIISDFVNREGKKPSVQDLEKLTNQYIAKNSTKLKEKLITDKLFDDAMDPNKNPDNKLWYLGPKELDARMQSVLKRPTEYGISQQQQKELAEKYNINRLRQERLSSEKVQSTFGERGTISTAVPFERTKDSLAAVFERVNRLPITSRNYGKLFDSALNATQYASEKRMQALGQDGIIKIARDAQPTEQQKRLFDQRPLNDRYEEGKKAFQAGKHYQGIFAANAQKVMIDPEIPGFIKSILPESATRKIQELMAEDLNVAEISKMKDINPKMVYVPPEYIPPSYKAAFLKANGGKGDDKAIGNAYYMQLLEISKGTKDHKWLQ